MNTNKHKTKVCLNCPNRFPITNGNRRRAKYCSDKCRIARNTGWKSTEVMQSLSTSTVGAVGELLVSVDLIKKGFEVFRAVSSACSSDLAILLKNKLYRVEVTTGYKLANNKITYPKKDKSKFDFLAVVIHSENSIYYYPDLPKAE